MRRKRPLCRCPAARDNLAHRPSAARRIVDLHAPNPPFEHAAAIGALSPSPTVVRGAAQLKPWPRRAENGLTVARPAVAEIRDTGHSPSRRVWQRSADSDRSSRTPPRRACRQGGPFPDPRLDGHRCGAASLTRPFVAPCSIVRQVEGRSAEEATIHLALCPAR
jgi:hypothetical protein